MYESNRTKSAEEVYSKLTDRFFQTSLAWIVVCVLLATILVVYLDGKVERLGFSFTQYGVVKIVDTCESSRSSYRCRIVTDKYTFKNHDITSYYQNTIKVGDIMSRKYVWETSGYRTYLCRNGKCRAASVCYEWMPCFSKAPVPDSLKQYYHDSFNRYRME